MQIRATAASNRVLGTAFERLVVACLKTGPQRTVQYRKGRAPPCEDLKEPWRSDEHFATIGGRACLLPTILNSNRRFGNGPMTWPVVNSPSTPTASVFTLSDAVSAWTC